MQLLITDPLDAALSSARETSVSYLFDHFKLLDQFRFMRNAVSVSDQIDAEVAPVFSFFLVNSLIDK